jgi:hypothetical protein
MVREREIESERAVYAGLLVNRKRGMEFLTVSSSEVGTSYHARDSRRFSSTTSTLCLSNSTLCPCSSILINCFFLESDPTGLFSTLRCKTKMLLVSVLRGLQIFPNRLQSKIFFWNWFGASYRGREREHEVDLWLCQGKQVNVL